MTAEQGPRRGRGRPRNPDAEAKIMAAALAEYCEHGWSGFTMDAVARRAGVGKSTVYLRWHDKDALLTDAVSAGAGAIAVEDTGTLRGDIDQMVRSTLRHFHTESGWASIRVTFDAASSPEPLGTFSEMVSAVHGAKVDQICARAVARGDLPADIPFGVVAEVIFGTALVHALSGRLEQNPDTDEELEARATWIVELVMRGIGG